MMLLFGWISEHYKVVAGRTTPLRFLLVMLWGAI
jgi:hypothetical protein